MDDAPAISALLFVAVLILMSRSAISFAMVMVCAAIIGLVLGGVF